MEVSNSSTVVAMTAAAAVVVKKSTVTFDKIEIREFAPMVGDNPAVSGGVPIALGSILIQQRVLSIKHYERDRAPRRDRKERRAM